MPLRSSSVGRGPIVLAPAPGDAEEMDGPVNETPAPPAQVAERVESAVGARLDEHHAPETNGRMAVCRRCGTQTDGPEGRQHVPSERQLARSSEWLDAQARASRIDSARCLLTK